MNRASSIRFFKAFAATICILLVVWAAGCAISSRSDSGIPYRAEIEDAANHFKVDPYLVAAVMMTESHGDPNAVSEAGAKGLMQVTDVAVQEMNQKGYVSKWRYWPVRIMDPKVNIRYGTAVLASNLERYGDEKTALAAYNGGTANADRWVEAANGADITTVIDLGETREYVDKVESTKTSLMENCPDAF